MLDTPTVSRLPADDPAVYAFEIRSGTRSEDVAAMAEVMNDAFARGETVSMLLLMRGVDLGDALAGLNLASLKAQARSASHVKKYAVVGAPAAAETMIRTMAPLIPVEPGLQIAEREKGKNQDRDQGRDDEQHVDPQGKPAAKGTHLKGHGATQ